ncbi:MAG: ATP-binding cassette domain-containing protein [Bacteriovoracaceae bacterium]|jgi:cell division transport system ATP-binding protein|nr:ATP-binding cassette domain-containing protein [Bacteriovoracaceae bacterium]
MNTVSFQNTNNSSNLHNKMMFAASDLSVHFGQIKALDNVNFMISKGDIIFITGKSGAGKSTLLNVLGSDQKLTRGSLSKVETNSFIARVYQDLKLINELTLLENLKIAYDSSLYKSYKEFNHDLNELVRFLGIEGKLSLKTSKANGGLKQKIAIIRALLTKPSVILCDEPTSSCDRESAIKLFELLNFYNVKRGLTIVWASHNRELVKQFPGKILHLESGKLVYSGHACFI